MNLALRAFALIPVLLLIDVLGTNAPHAVAADKPQVSVNWTDPFQFKEATIWDGLYQSNPEAWLGEFASTIRRRANKLLQTRQTLSVTITDVQRARTVRPWPPPSGVRVADENSPPEINLRFTLTGADGQVIDSGDRELRDPSALTTSLPVNSAPNAYEDRLLNNWMDKEFGGGDE